MFKQSNHNMIAEFPFQTLYLILSRKFIKYLVLEKSHFLKTK